jgi:DNA-binding MarR family transcriptional regulator
MSVEVESVERLLFEIIRPLYARDTLVSGLWELPVAQLRVLNVLGSGPEERTPTMGELAEALGVALSTATQIVERIERRGLVKREHCDPDDRRVVRLALTDSGRQLVEARKALRHERLTRTMAQLTSEQAEALVQALTPLAAAAGRLNDNPAQADAALPRLLRSESV